jgi:hypothetical protein
MTAPLMILLVAACFLRGTSSSSFSQCTASSLENSYFEYDIVSSRQVVLGPWQRPSNCTLEPWRESVDGKSIVVVGDSVSRYLYFDLAWELHNCPPWQSNYWHVPALAPDAPPSLSPQCTELMEFISKKSRGDLLQYLPRRNITLQFVWVQSYMEFSWNKWQERLFGGGPTALHYDALLMSAGLWDVDQLAGGSASLARHCTSISVVVDFFLRTFLPQDRSGTLQNRILVWGAPFSEPFVHPLTGHSLVERFPPASVEEANQCVSIALESTRSMRFLNTSSLLKVPSDVYRVLEAQSGGTTPGSDGRMLTLDGYHPSRRVRALLLDELLGSVATSARWRRKRLKSGGVGRSHGAWDGEEEAAWNVGAGGALGLLTVLAVLSRCTKERGAALT